MEKSKKRKTAREAIPKRIRFEVFKRDSFRCQYCGAQAPNVLLHVDHIDPVAKGGTNEILNLITSCSACNLGKSDIPLDDNSAVMKAVSQVEELQERREQLEMMLAWREGLRDLKDESIEKLCKYWEKNTPTWAVNDHGKKCIEKWLGDYSFDEIIKAMDIAARQYLELDSDGRVTVNIGVLVLIKYPEYVELNDNQKKTRTLKIFIIFVEFYEKDYRIILIIYVPYNGSRLQEAGMLRWMNYVKWR